MYPLAANKEKVVDSYPDSYHGNLLLTRNEITLRMSLSSEREALPVLPEVPVKSLCTLICLAGESPQVVFRMRMGAPDIQ
jgi:hypothetical protein